MSKQSYIRGFCKAAEAHGVDPQALAKFAHQKIAGKISPTRQQVIDVARDAAKIVAEKNPHGVIDTLDAFNDKTKIPAQLGATALGNYMKPFWNPEAGALNAAGTNIVNRFRKVFPPHIPISTEMANNALRPIFDQNGGITPYGTNQIDKVIRNASKIRAYLDSFNK